VVSDFLKWSEATKRTDNLWLGKLINKSWLIITPNYLFVIIYTRAHPKQGYNDEGDTILSFSLGV